MEPSVFKVYYLKVKKLLYVHVETPPLEFLFYFLIWAFSILSTLYIYHSELYSKVDFFALNYLSVVQDGYSSYKSDNSHFELSFISTMIKHTWPFQIVFMASYKISNVKYKKYFSICFTLIFLIWYFGIYITLYFLFPIYLIYLINLLNNDKVTVISGILLIVLNTQSVVAEVISEESMEQQLVHITSLWVLCRIISFCVDSEGTDRSLSTDIIEALNYCLYFPCFLFGPLISYRKFSVQFNKSNANESLENVFKRCLPLLAWYLFWFLVLILFNQIFLVNAVQSLPEFFEKLSLAGICGYEFASAFTFMLNYTCIYGLPGVVSLAHQIKLPSPPRCVGCIPLFSYFWRYFDPGMHEFIRSYLYLPLIKNVQNLFFKIFATFLSFLFIYIWHGYTSSILIWTIFNFFGIVVEIIARNFSSSKLATQIFRSLSKANAARLIALFVTPLYFTSIATSTFFLSNTEISLIMIRKVFESSLNVFLVFIVTYSGAHFGLIFLKCIKCFE